MKNSYISSFENNKEYRLKKRHIASFVIIFLLLSEISLRFTFSEEEINGNYWGVGAFEYSDTTGYKHAAGFNGYAVRRGVFKCPIKINELNLRQSNTKSQLQYAKRIVVLGSSFGFGLGVKEEAAFSTLMQRKLNAKGFGIINGSQTGYCLEQIVNFGIPLSEIVKPNFIIACIAIPYHMRVNYERSYKNIDIKYGYRLSKERMFKVPILDFLRTHSYLLMRLDYEINKEKKRKKVDEFEELMKHQPQKAIAPTLRSIKEISDYCNRNKIKLAIVIIDRNLNKTTMKSLLYTYLESTNILFLNIVEEGRLNQDDFMNGDSHWNEQGHYKAARSLTRFILESYK